MLGTNGGGFFNVNSAMPYENPTWLSNFVEMLAILIIPAGLTATYGRMVDNRRQGWMVFGAMMTLFVVAVAVIYVNESGPTPAMQAAGLTGDNLEGKEMRFGIGSTLAVRRRHHRRVVRRRQRRDGVAQRPRRRGPDGADDDRRGHLGRRRLGPVLDAAVRHPRRLHLRPDGRAHARVPRQEDRGARDQADDHRHDRRADDGAGRHRARDRLEVGRPVDLRQRAAGLLRDALRLHVAGQQQRLGVRRLHRLPAAERHERRRLRHLVRRRARRPGDARRPLPADARRARRRGLARRQAGQPGRASARCAPTRRRSASCSSRSC